MDKQQLLEEVKFDQAGLIPVIVQDAHSKKVRMLAYMNKQALMMTLEKGLVHYYSRSRNELWLKGETSGHYQYLKGVKIDCDKDTLLIQIEQEGGISCHTGNATCFYTELEGNIEQVKSNEDIQVEVEEGLSKLYQTIVERKNNPKAGSYTNYLLEKGEDKILKKVGEETTEVVIATKNNSKEELVGEIADLMYHLSVLMVEKDVDWKDVFVELEKRT